MWIARLIALVQIIGGAQGMFLVVWSGGLIHSPMMGIFMLAVFAIIVAGGAGSLIGETTDRWRKLAIIAQAIQIPLIQTGHFIYVLAAGAGVWFGIGNHATAYERTIGSRFDLMFQSGFGPQIDNAPVILGVNVVALASLIFLLTRHRGSRSTVKSDSAFHVISIPQESR
jgi:hypothetical protein